MDSFRHEDEPPVGYAPDLWVKRRGGREKERRRRKEREEEEERGRRERKGEGRM